MSKYKKDDIVKCTLSMIDPIIAKITEVTKDQYKINGNWHNIKTIDANKRWTLN